MAHHNLMMVIVSFSFLLLSYAHAICVPRNSSYLRFNLVVPSLQAQSPLPAAFPAVAASPKVDSDVSHVDPLLQHLCDVTDNPLLCLSSIAPLLTGTADPISILQKEIEASTKEVNLAIAEIDKVVSDDTSLENTTVTCLQACKEAYLTAIDDLAAALTAISVGDVGKMNTELSAFVTNVYDCDLAFEEVGPEVDNPVEDTFDKLRKLGGNNLAIAQAIKI